MKHINNMFSNCGVGYLATLITIITFALPMWLLGQHYIQDCERKATVDTGTTITNLDGMILAMAAGGSQARFETLVEDFLHLRQGKWMLENYKEDLTPAMVRLIEEDLKKHNRKF